MKSFNQFVTEGPTYDSARKIAPGINPDILKKRLAKNAQRNQQSQPGNTSGQKRLPAQKRLPGSSTAPKTNKPNDDGTNGKLDDLLGSIRGEKKKPTQSVKPQRGSSIVLRDKTTTRGTKREAIGKSVADKQARTKPSAGYMGKPDGPGPQILNPLVPNQLILKIRNPTVLDQVMMVTGVSL